MRFCFRYPAVVILAAAVAGTLLGYEIHVGHHVLAAGALAALIGVLFAALRLPPEYFVLPIALFIMAAACLHADLTYHSFPADDIGLAARDGNPRRFFGTVAEWPTLKRHRTILTIAVDSAVAGDTVIPASGSLLVTLGRETTRFAIGDQISFTGRLRAPAGGAFPGRFDYARYLYTKGIRGTVWVNDPAQILTLKEQPNRLSRLVNSLRGEIIACLHRNLSDDAAALASGFLIGETHDISEDVYRAFRRTGTMHLLAVSGSNVALVLIVALFLLRFVPLTPTARAIVLLAIVIVFSNLSYNQPSVVRASIMAALYLLARLFYRRADLNNIIAAAAVLLVAYQPGNLFDIGFQLSFAVTWGLILFLPHINRRLEPFRMPSWVRYGLLIAFSSLIATLISAPITGYYFGETSLVTVASNLLIVPLVSVAVIGIMIVLLVNLALPVAAIIPGAALDRLLGIINGLVAWFDGWEFASLPLPSFPALYAYLFLAGVILAFLAISFRFFRRTLVFFLLTVAATGLLIDAVAPADARARIEVFNPSGSQAVIIDYAGGLVAFHQGDGRYDGFCGDLLPYLKGRPGPFPQYFLFLEPRFQTDRRLDLAGEVMPRIIFQPVAGEASRNIPSFWTTAQSDIPAADDTTGLVFALPGAAAVHFREIPGMLFTESVLNLALIPESRFDDIGYIFLFAADDKALTDITFYPSAAPLVVLLERPVEKYNTLQDSQLRALLEGGVERILAPGEQLIIDMGR